MRLVCVNCDQAVGSPPPPKCPLCGCRRFEEAVGPADDDFDDGDGESEDADDAPRIVLASEAKHTRVTPISTGVAEWDRALGGGIVGNVMVSGLPKAGKSTYAAVVASRIAKRLGGTALYLVSEPGMTTEIVAANTKRGGGVLSSLAISEVRSLREALRAVAACEPCACVWDSVSRFEVGRSLSKLERDARVIDAALRVRVPTILIVHANKGGTFDVDGSAEHDVSAKLWIDREYVECQSNRFNQKWPKRVSR